MSESFRVTDTAAATSPRRGRRALSSPVRSTRVDPRIWRLALAAADGDPRRIVVETRERVPVVNQPTNRRSKS